MLIVPAFSNPCSQSGAKCIVSYIPLDSTSEAEREILMSGYLRIFLSCTCHPYSTYPGLRSGDHDLVRKPLSFETEGANNNDNIVSKEMWYMVSLQTHYMLRLGTIMSSVKEMSQSPNDEQGTHYSKQ